MTARFQTIADADAMLREAGVPTYSELVGDLARLRFEARHFADNGIGEVFLRRQIEVSTQTIAKIGTLRAAGAAFVTVTTSDRELTILAEHGETERQTITRYAAKKRADAARALADAEMVESAVKLAAYPLQPGEMERFTKVI